MNTKAIRQLADVTLDKYRSSIPRKAFEEFVKDIITGENRATAFRYEASPICRASFPSTLDEDGARCTVEVTVYRLNAVAVTAFLLDGPETLLRHIGLDGGDDELSPYVYDGSMALADHEKMQQAREAFDRLADTLREIAAKLAEAMKPVINAVLSAFKKLWKVSARAIGVPPKWLHLAAHAKKARTRKKYRNRIRRYVFEALAAEGGGGP